MVDSLCGIEQLNPRLRRFANQALPIANCILDAQERTFDEVVDDIYEFEEEKPTQC